MQHLPRRYVQVLIKMPKIWYQLGASVPDSACSQPLVMFFSCFFGSLCCWVAGGGGVSWAGLQPRSLASITGPLVMVNSGARNCFGIGCPQSFVGPKMVEKRRGTALPSPSISTWSSHTGRLPPLYCRCSGTWGRRHGTHGGRKPDS